MGRGGISLLSASTSLSRDTVRKGIRELHTQAILETNRVRQEGGGRRRSEINDPSLKSDLFTLVDSSTRGDPQSPVQWTSKSLSHLTQALRDGENKHKVSVSVVRRLLHEEHFSLQSNRKTKEGGNHPDRDLQFQHIAEETKKFQKAREPVISVDGKKKEPIGDFKNGGKEWKPQGSPTEVQVYDFLPKDGIRAVPYGIYDIAHNHGFVNVGISADTAVFAGKSILKWWEEEGNASYPHATKLLITADGGGSNGSRVRLWKALVQDLANKIGLSITVCHYPPGTSKWNKIEHRLFSPITANWRATPLVSLETLTQLVSHTTTKTGLTVTCRVDTTKYMKGIKPSDKKMASIQIKRHNFHGEWNYTIYPKTKKNG